MKKQWNKKIVIITGIILLICVGIFCYIKFFQRENNLVDNYNYSDTQLASEALPVDVGNIFTIPEYYQIMSPEYMMCVYSIFQQNGYLAGENNGKYFFTKIKDRVKKVVAYGNFTNEEDLKDLDMAFLLEENDFRSSALYIVSSKCNLLFYKYYDDELPIINSFYKGQKIFMDSQELVPSPSDGIILKFKYSKKALLFNPKTKTFEEYHQYTREEINDINKEERYFRDEYEEEPVTYVISDPEGYANLRENNNANSQIIQQIKSGEKVEVLDNEGNWWLIKTQEGNQGYVYYNRVITR
ncbi:SH3 domain-containing protein [Apibacter raozihei]|uniref:SH3 domain-containing protein n=1 Tax=Apibacter raozihei TaxID=2500547 RepID=UPI000FE35743|nr:SH3 domain-containing protein [Apibacter raozihei]